MPIRMDSRTPGAVAGVWRNRDTGELVRWVRWVELEENPETPSLFSAFRCNPQEWKAKGLDLAEIVYEDRARLLFIPRAPRMPGKATDQRDLAGSLDEARKSLVNPKLLIPGEECEYPGCHKLSAFRVSHEQEIEPQVDADGNKGERAVMLEVHCYCAAHYRLPRFKSIRGVESEVQIEEGARPQ